MVAEGLQGPRVKLLENMEKRPQGPEEKLHRQGMAGDAGFD
jgi:hypothetical protein